MNLNSPTFKLFKCDHSFWNGVASMYDYSPVQSKYKTLKTEVEADCRAIQNDWRAIGMDMHNAMNQYDQESK